MALQWISKILGGGVAEAAKGFGSIFSPNKEAKSVREHDNLKSSRDQYSSEFIVRNNRTWFDSFADGLNRLVRPTMAFGCIGLISMSFINPYLFLTAMQGLILVPSGLWAMMSAITVFYFGGRYLEKRKSMQVDQDAIRASMELAALKEKLKPNQAMSDDAYKGELQDTSKPMSNEAIMEWNKRNREG